MNWTRIALLAALALLPVAGLSQTGAKPVSTGGVQRPCQQADLVGNTYKMVVFRETPKRREARWNEQFPYQYLTFKPSNVYGMIATNVEVKSPKTLNSYLVSRKGRDQRYILTGDGVLSLLENDLLQNNYRCTAILKDVNGYVKGDVLLNGYTRKAKSELYKLYRRWY